MKHRASVYISYETLRQALDIPGCVNLALVISDDYDKLNEVVHFIFENDKLPIQAEGGMPVILDIDKVKDACDL